MRIRVPRIALNSLALAEERNGKLPKNYESACFAISECYRIDECKYWTNKAEALASYARQSKDETLLKTAKRIKGRAFRRVGELLGEIEAKKGGDRKSDQCTANGTLISRKQAATDAGLSKRQKDQALRVANVPAERFEDLIESDDPPTITELAEMGTVKADHLRVGEQSKRPGFKEAMDVYDGLRRFSDELCKINPKQAAIGFLKSEHQDIRCFIETIRRWILDIESFL